MRLPKLIFTVVTMVLLSACGGGSNSKSNSVTNQSNGLVAHYKFEGNGKDSSGNGNDGTEYGGVNYVDGVVGRAANFNGNSSYIRIPHNEKFNFQQFSISVWINISKSFFGNGSNVIIEKPYISHTDFHYQWHLGVKGNEYLTNKYGNTFNVHFMAPNSQEIRTINEIKRFSKEVIGQWKHIVVTYNGKKLNTYVNNVSTSSKNVDFDIPYYDTDIFIAKHGNLDRANKDYTPILLDELYIYNRALNKSEISKLYNKK